MSLQLTYVLRIAGALGLLGLCSAVLAAMEGHKKQDLKIGMGYVVPTYVAATKFRTPESLDTALAEDLAKRTRSPLSVVRVDAGNRTQMLASRKIDAFIADASPSDSLHRSLTPIPTGYLSAPMAIMRTDTTIRNPVQLRGRKVCISEGGAYVGMLAKKYGAIEIVNKAPADSLLSLRIGTCDAAVHDSALLEELIKLPEWRKFSASFYLGAPVPQAFFVRNDDATMLTAAKQASAEWRKTDFPNKEIRQMVRHIAFEVYLDQNVPDCH